MLSAALAPAGDFCVSGSSDKSVRVWDIGKRECVQTLQELNHTDQVSPLNSFRMLQVTGSFMQVWGVALSGTTVVSVGDDGAACVYSAAGRAQ